MSMRKLWNPAAIIAAALTAVGLLSSACGGGEQATPTAAPQPTATARPQATAAAPQATATAAKPVATITVVGGQTIKQYASYPPLTVDRNKTYTAKMSTTEGVMTFNLLVGDAPLAVNSFIFLAREGYYDNVKFHRIIEGFMVQSGDPTGTGAGGPGYQFRDERVTRDYVRGTLAMANAGPNTNGSQFFIVHANYPLPKAYTIFGLLTDGSDVLDKIAKTPVAAGPGGERSVPTRDVRIQRIDIEEK